MDTRRNQIMFISGQVLPQDVYWAEEGPDNKRELLVLRKEIADLRGGAAAATQGSGGTRAKARPTPTSLGSEDRAELLKRAETGGRRGHDALLELFGDESGED
jgi:hypothetical protein